MSSNRADDVPPSGTAVTRRDFVHPAVMGTTALAFGDRALGFFPTADDRDAVFAQVTTQHGATVKMLQDWIALPSIAAENRGMAARMA